MRYGHQGWLDIMAMPLDRFLSIHAHISDIIDEENKSGGVSRE
jgi:hypothetical protein